MAQILVWANTHEELLIWKTWVYSQLRVLFDLIQPLVRARPWPHEIIPRAVDPLHPICSAFFIGLKKKV